MSAVVFWVCVFLIIYVYALYPLLLLILAWWSPHRLSHEIYEPSVTLLIAAYNEKETIALKLENSLALDYPADRLQILVAADGSDDGTEAIVRTFFSRGVELSFLPERRGKMAAISNAMGRAKGEIVVLSDANNLYEAQTIKELVRPFRNPDIGAVSGSKHIIEGDGSLGESEGLYWKYEAWIKKQETLLGCCTAASGEVFTFRRELFVLPPENIINDDFYMLMRIIKKGFRAVYVPEAESREHISLTAQDEIERRSRIVAGRFQAMALAGELLPWNRPLIVWQIVSHKFMRTLVPFAMILAFIASIHSVLWPSSIGPIWVLPKPYNWMVFFLQLLFYFVAWLGNRIPLPKLLYLATFLVNSNVAALIGFLRFITRRQSAIWKRAKRREDIASTGGQ